MREKKTVTGDNLEFISAIENDGSGTFPIHPDFVKSFKKSKFRLIKLSDKHKTWLAFEHGTGMTMIVREITQGGAVG